jgi:PhzF family phenazine biosynthesis protein
MKIPFYQVDAFTSRAFGGNPAAVMPLDAWLPDDVLQAIAMENNLSETAFFVPSGNQRFQLRWFTPAVEVPLCGHATLASAHVILRMLHRDWDAAHFDTKSGLLSVRKSGDMLAMDFPARQPSPCAPPPALIEGLGRAPLEVLRTTEDMNYYAVFESEMVVRGVAPDFARLKGLAPAGICVTAPGETADFVSRYFAPSHGIDEDPVTGSTHCALIPLWAAKLGRTNLAARQVSKRMGELQCELHGARVTIAGQAVTVLAGQFLL